MARLDSLATAALVVVDDGPDRPADKSLSHAFLWAAHPANAEAAPPRNPELALRWLRRRSLPLNSITDPVPVTIKKWTDSGNRHDPRGLKQRDANAVRNVPIPLWLVQILKAHIKEFGVADDGRLFRNERAGIVGSSTFSRV